MDAPSNADKLKLIGMAIVAVSIYLSIVVGFYALITVTWAAGIFLASGLLSVLGIGDGFLSIPWCLGLALLPALLFGWRITE